MQNPNPVIKNYIFNPEPLILRDNIPFRSVGRKNTTCLKADNNKISLIRFF